MSNVTPETTNADVNAAIRAGILAKIDHSPASLKELAQELSASTQKIITTVTMLRKERMVNFVDGLVSKRTVEQNDVEQIAAEQIAAQKPSKSKAVKEKVAKIDPSNSQPRVTKTTVAWDIFREMFASHARKDVINEMIAKAGLTAAGAATYYQNFKKKLSESEGVQKVIDSAKESK